jgi:hypothetical protein
MASPNPNSAPIDGAGAEQFQQQQQQQQPLQTPDPYESPNPYASSSRWRHAESTAYARFEQERALAQSPPQQQYQGQGLGHHHHTGPVAREADTRGGAGVSDLADFLNKSRIDPSEVRTGGPGGAGVGPGGDNRPNTPRFKPVIAGATEARAATAEVTGEGAHDEKSQVSRQQEGPGGPPPPADGKEIVCGPLLNYRRMEGRRWVGSVLVVTAGGGREQPLVPKMELRRYGGGGGGGGGQGQNGIEGYCLYSDSRNTFWRFDIKVDMEEVETRWEYELPGMRLASRTKPRVNNFFVPALSESMRIMFHSCNGFSVGTDEAAWSGPALWNDVRRKHQEMPFHVM